MNDHTRRKPPGNIVLPALSPPMISADDAARFAHEAIGNKRDKEYGGLILQGESGRFFATLPIGGNLYVDFTLLLAVDAQGNFIHPDGYTCHGLYHSHPNVLALVNAIWSPRGLHSGVALRPPKKVMRRWSLPSAFIT